MGSLVKKASIFIASALLLAILALTLFPVDIIDIRQPVGLAYPRALPTTGRHFGSLDLKDKVVRQTFKPEAKNISGIGIFFSKKTNNPKSGVINFYLKINKGKKFETIFKTSKKAENIRVPAIYTIYFKPVKVREGVVYAIVVDGNGLRSGMTPFASLYDAYKGGDAYLNGKKSSRDIVFQTYHKTNLLGFFSEKSRLSPLLLFFIFLSTVLGALLLALNNEQVSLDS